MTWMTDNLHSYLLRIQLWIDVMLCCRKCSKIKVYKYTVLTLNQKVVLSCCLQSIFKSSEEHFFEACVGHERVNSHGSAFSQYSLQTRKTTQHRRKYGSFKTNFAKASEILVLVALLSHQGLFCWRYVCYSYADTQSASAFCETTTRGYSQLRTGFSFFLLITELLALTWNS